ncbi:MAG: hypothetical protein AAGO57_00345 [Pseudomonadota bacterium]
MQSSDIHGVSAQPAGEINDRIWWMILGLLVVAGLFFRLNWFGDYTFPINDGALFVVIAEAIQANGMLPPTEYDFNGHTLPLGYPPLALWLVAAISSVTGADTVLVATWYPFVMNMIFVGGFIVFLRAMKLPWLVLVVAAAIFIFQDRTFKFLIMGGGITRGTGAALAILSWVATIKMLEEARPMRVLAAILLCGLTILSHLEFGITSATGITLLILMANRSSTERLLLLFTVGGGAFLVILPWLNWVLSTHGLAPFSSASETSGWCFPCSGRKVLELGMFPWYIMIPAALGVVELARQRQNFWIILALAIWFITPRHAPSPLVIPNAVLAAYGLLFMFRLVSEGLEAWENPTDGHNITLLSTPLSTATFLALFAATITTLGATREMYERTGMETLPREIREVMVWVDDSLPENSRFVIFTGEPWATDETAEWFPYLTSSLGLSTAQGLEWAGPNVFTDKLRQLSILTSTAACTGLVENTIEAFPTAEYLLAVRLKECYDDDPRYTALHRNEWAAVYRITAR